jgi:hypothetical protein
MGLWKEHFHWSVLLRWDVLGWILAAVWTAAGIMLFFDQYLGADVCFMLSAVIIFSKIGQIAIMSTDLWWHRLLFSFLLFGFFGMGIVETVRGVNRWAESKREPKGQSDAALIPPTPKEEAPEPPPTKKQEAPPAAAPLRRPIKVQAEMLRNWIGQTAAQTNVNEMWLSQIFDRLLDNIPDGPDVDVPAALRYLDSKGEVEILETSHRIYRTWWRETFQEDIRFKIKNSASGSSPQESIKDSKSARQEKSSQPKAKSPAGSEQQQSGKADTQIGSITTGPCSNLQIGGSNNSATGGNCAPQARRLLPADRPKLVSTLGVCLSIPLRPADCA